VVVSAAGAAVEAAGASSFLLHAVRATASRETISRDFFMVLSLINSKDGLLLLAMNNYR
jgi:hypothetical protein